MTELALTDSYVLPFVLIPVALALALAWGAGVAWRRRGASPASARRAALMTLVGSAIWMALTWIAASLGVLLDWQRTPPPFAILVLLILVMAFAIAFSPFGRRLAGLPLWTLIAVQGFRLPLELAMHRLYERGIMPVQMSYSGRNGDIITGITALIVAALVWSGRAGRGLVAVWNVLGLVLLANIITVAILSTPRFQYFGRDQVNVFVMYAPFVWLPAVMVLAALAGHLLVFRAINAR